MAPLKKKNPVVRYKSLMLLSAGFAALATAGVAQVGAPQAPLKLKSDYLGYAVHVL